MDEFGIFLEGITDTLGTVIVRTFLQKLRTVTRMYRKAITHESHMGYKQFEPLRSDLNKMFLTCGAPSVTRISTDDKLFTSIQKKLLIGETVDIVNPLDTSLIPLTLKVYEQKEGVSAPLKAQIAGILSLWEWEQKNNVARFTDLNG